MKGYCSSISGDFCNATAVAVVQQLSAKAQRIAMGADGVTGTVRQWPSPRDICHFRIHVACVEVLPRATSFVVHDQPREANSRCGRYLARTSLNCTCKAAYPLLKRIAQCSQSPVDADPVRSNVIKQIAKMDQ